MSVHPLPAEKGDFAFEVLERPGPNEWLALLVRETEVERVADSLAEEIHLTGDVQPLRDTIRSASALVQLAHKQSEDILVLSGFDALSLDDWRQLDVDRSRLMRNGTTVLVLGEAALGQLFRHAPNLASWLGGSAWRLERTSYELSPQQREARLAALRQWSGMTDVEVVARAERNELPSDPPYAEWLVLLNRGDLLG